jgi:hypothetical protein
LLVERVFATRIARLPATAGPDKATTPPKRNSETQSEQRGHIGIGLVNLVNIEV